CGLASERFVSPVVLVPREVDAQHEWFVAFDLVRSASVVVLGPLFERSHADVAVRLNELKRVIHCNRLPAAEQCEIVTLLADTPISVAAGTPSVGHYIVCDDYLRLDTLRPQPSVCSLGTSAQAVRSAYAHYARRAS